MVNVSANIPKKMGVCKGVRSCRSSGSSNISPKISGTPRWRVNPNPEARCLTRYASTWVVLGTPQRLGGWGRWSGYQHPDLLLKWDTNKKENRSSRTWIFVVKMIYYVYIYIQTIIWLNTSMLYYTFYILYMMYLMSWLCWCFLNHGLALTLKT